MGALLPSSFVRLTRVVQGHGQHLCLPFVFFFQYPSGFYIQDWTGVFRCLRDTICKIFWACFCTDISRSMGGGLVCILGGVGGF